jgi:hypothetical protein
MLCTCRVWNCAMPAVLESVVHEQHLCLSWKKHHTSEIIDSQ